ncbi:hypothetical protein, partial [Methylogaea oryzae]
VGIATGLQAKPDRVLSPPSPQLALMFFPSPANCGQIAASPSPKELGPSPLASPPRRKLASPRAPPFSATL